MLAPKTGMCYLIFMSYHYILWATGEDRAGIVADVAHELYLKKCNLEDSAMMRLGSEFGILLIFSSKNKLSNSEELIKRLRRKKRVNVGLKPISASNARFQIPKNPSYLVSVHGQDKPGLVFHVANLLRKYRFNITDLNTHRTVSGPKPGYILIIEGEIPSKSRAKKLETALKKLQKSLKTIVTFNPVPNFKI